VEFLTDSLLHVGFFTQHRLPITTGGGVLFEHLHSPRMVAENINREKCQFWGYDTCGTVPPVYESVRHLKWSD